MRLNSSKQPHEPDWAKPKTNLVYPSVSIFCGKNLVKYSRKSLWQNILQKNMNFNLTL